MSTISNKVPSKARLPKASTTSPGDSGARRFKVRSAEVGLSVLTALGGMGGSASLTALAKQLDEPPAKVHRYLQSLVSAGFIDQDSVSSHYSLGREAMIIGLQAQRQSEALKLASEELKVLTEKMDVTTFVAVMGNLGPVIVRWEEPARAVVLNIRVGWVMPMLWSATGRAFAAFSNDAEIDALVAQDLKNATPAQRKMLPNRAAVNLLLAEYREHGCAWIRDTLLSGVAGVAVPIFDATGRVAAVIGALGVAGTFDESPNGTYAQTLLQSAAALSRRAGYSP